MPSAQGFIDASLAGIGRGMNPEHLVQGHLDTGRLVELSPQTPLYWQIDRLAVDRLSDLTREVAKAARHLLLH